MSDTTATLRHQIDSATELQGVVRTMRALAASSISQYEQSVLALADYRRAVTLSLGACLRPLGAAVSTLREEKATAADSLGAIVFGSDQGLVGQFNEIIADYAVAALRALPGKRTVWAVGERVRARLEDAGVAVAGAYAVPGSVEAIARLVDRLQLDTETQRSQPEQARIHVFYNQPQPGAQFRPVAQRLLPLDAQWLAALLAQRWPTRNPPQVIGDGTATLRALIREHLFISLFSACAESLASENASRLAAMERADKNIDELLDSLRSRFHSERQSAIDEELFDVTAGYEALSQAGTADGGL
ncbi:MULTISPECIES: F0F1 ATP synthase subunit gamma [Cupriavidus]|uniref:F0F1 ATP synthase subunit gamma n=1 Tax=Cupriavidus TaxID=106589 RepID=UPI00037E4286|nr:MULTISPECIES: F0F1 ATP synthase subunit gamma [Cupriavidus]